LLVILLKIIELISIRAEHVACVRGEMRDTKLGQDTSREEVMWVTLMGD
jgi:hypothetical protein